MAIFRTRSDSQRGQDAARKSNVPVDSVETLRTRARQRLIGAVVLVVLGILGFSLLFDTQPRPIPVNIEISIPDKDKAERLEMPAIPTATAVATAPTAPTVGPSVIPPVSPANPAPAAVAAAPSVKASASLSPKEELMSGKPVVNEAVKPAGKPPAEKVAAKPPVADDGAKARALLEGRDPVKESAKVVDDKAADGASRFVVQVGAFADGTKAHEVRVKLERAGLKTYTHVAQTRDGARTRVRVGPFAKREDAEKAAAKIKKIDLPAAILTL